MADPRGVLGIPHSRSNVFHFRAVFGKKFLNDRLVHFSRESFWNNVYGLD